MSVDDLLVLLDQEGVRPMTHGFHTSIRAKIVGVTPQKPLGIDYGVTLMNANHERVFGFDNSHRFTNAGPLDPYDHEHRVGEPGITYEYRFTSSYQLISDFYDRLGKYASDYHNATSNDLEFLKDTGQ